MSIATGQRFLGTLAYEIKCKYENKTKEGELRVGENKNQIGAIG